MENVLFEKKGNIAIVTINRPKALNALNSAVLKDLAEAFTMVEEDESIHVAILTGAGDKSFVAGADIGEMLQFSAIEGKRFGDLGNKVFLMIENCTKPFIAAINGFALGGGCEI
ncbi:MAG TPA: enoyl-CoA hydratase-related protein, partial [Oscillospiraceae bacterium]|nr:enoyl-CoA hydratase-related protein [Oscillospiraceae bacterium]